MAIDGVDVPVDSPARYHAGVLLVRVAVGDRAAFGQLYDMLAPRAFGLILRVLVNRALSEEVLQDVFLEVWQSASGFVPNKGQGRSWVLTIAHRRAVDRVRTTRASTERDEKAGLRELNSGQDSVDDQVALRIESRRVARAMDALPDAQREALLLSYVGGYSQSEIAALVGSPLGTIKTRMRDGLSRLRQEMGVTS
jgi:RNA polymerase sigma-70 factor (ECF subfamily)